MGLSFVVGTQTGCVRALKYPLDANMEHFDYFIHSAPVTKLCFSYDDRYLFSAAEDGVITINVLSDGDERYRPVQEVVDDVILADKNIQEIKI
jgi:hypothetical protein